VCARRNYIHRDWTFLMRTDSPNSKTEARKEATIHLTYMRWFHEILDQQRTLTSWPDEAFSRTKSHLAKVLLAQNRPEDIETANELCEAARTTLHRLLLMDSPPELDGVTDESILFDHLMPISPGGPRFTGQGLLERFMQKQ
jgi:hypothetical protein